jgi:hypothetical protein
MHLPSGRTLTPPCYNLVVLGAGTAGLICAAEPPIGGEVASSSVTSSAATASTTAAFLQGIIRAARAIHEARKVPCSALPGGDARLDFGRAMERMRQIRAEISPHDSARRFRE